MKVGIIDYKGGNLQSVCNAFLFLGADVKLITTPEDAADVTHIVLPGQGAFGDCATKLKEAGLFDFIPEWIAENKPFLGICVGYQLLFENSEENADDAGFGVLKGSCKKFQSDHLKVPHMGWNAVNPGNSDHPIWEGLGEIPYFYFVHSYYPISLGESSVVSTSEYGVNFHCAVAKNNLIATQFHPEKSQHAGLQLLRNFLKLK